MAQSEFGNETQDFLKILLVVSTTFVCALSLVCQYVTTVGRSWVFDFLVLGAASHPDPLDPSFMCIATVMSVQTFFVCIFQPRLDTPSVDLNYFAGVAQITNMFSVITWAALLPKEKQQPVTKCHIVPFVLCLVLFVCDAERSGMNALAAVYAFGRTWKYSLPVSPAFPKNNPKWLTYAACATPFVLSIWPAAQLNTAGLSLLVLSAVHSFLALAPLGCLGI